MSSPFQSQSFWVAFCVNAKIVLHQGEIHLYKGEEARPNILGKRLQIVQREKLSMMIV